MEFIYNYFTLQESLLCPLLKNIKINAYFKNITLFHITDGLILAVKRDYTLLVKKWKST